LLERSIEFTEHQTNDNLRATIIEDFIKNLKETIPTLSPGLAGFLIGLITPKIYELLSEDQKQKWKQTFPIHHGEAGVVLSGVSIIGRVLLAFIPNSNNSIKIAKKICETLIGIGAGLTLEDIKDFNMWFKKAED